MAVTVKQAATRLEVSQTTVYALVAAGKLRVAGWGWGRGVIRISDEQLAEYLCAAEPRTGPPAPAARVRSNTCGFPDRLPQVVAALHQMGVMTRRSSWCPGGPSE